MPKWTESRIRWDALNWLQNSLKILAIFNLPSDGLTRLEGIETLILSSSTMSPSYSDGLTRLEGIETSAESVTNRSMSISDGLTRLEGIETFQCKNGHLPWYFPMD